uniref:Uncharacterized protein n=1 Tax=Rhizophora mucronata TaxID=61149 RepID=A0A2P2NTH4_RHIMU
MGPKLGFPAWLKDFMC